MNIITIGGATQDVFLEYEAPNSHCSLSALLETFQPGKKIEIADIVYITGGGATNTAVSFSLLGHATQIVCSLGNDAASSAVIHELKSHNIDTSLISNSSIYETGKSFVLKTIGKDRTIFTYRGSNNALNFDKLTEKEIAQTQALYITSLSKQAAESLPDLLLLAKKHNLHIALNPGNSQLTNNNALLKKTLKMTNTFIVNACEATLFMETLTGDILQKQKPEDVQDPSAPYLLTSASMPNCFDLNLFFKTVLAAGPSTVIVTNGINGVYAATRHELIFMPSIKTDIVDTVGAGDAFGSCFVSNLLQGISLEQSLMRGSINSCSVLKHTGAKQGLLTAEHIEQLEKTSTLTYQKFNTSW